MVEQNSRINKVVSIFDEEIVGYKFDFEVDDGRSEVNHNNNTKKHFMLHFILGFFCRFIAFIVCFSVASLYISLIVIPPILFAISGNIDALAFSLVVSIAMLWGLVDAIWSSITDTEHLTSLSDFFNAL